MADSTLGAAPSRTLQGDQIPPEPVGFGRSARELKLPPGLSLKGLLLAGGHGTRLRPLTHTGNKHMIPIANEPMLYYGLRNLAEVGIRDVAIVLGPLHEGIPESVGDGRAFGLRVTYVHQGDPKGLAHAVMCARDFLGDDPFVMYLGDNLLQAGAKPLVRRFLSEPVDAVIGVTPVLHPSHYGVVELDGGKIVSILEKPANPRSNLALIGVYLFTPGIHSIIEELKPSARGELEITEAIWNLHGCGRKLAVEQVEGWWKDTGRPEDLLEANQRILSTLPREHFSIVGTVEGGAEISGMIRLGAGSVVGSGVRIQGPVVIGNGTRIEGSSHVGPGTAIGSNCRIRGSSIQRTILMDGARVEGPMELSDSIVGRFAQLQAAEGRHVQLSCVLGDSTRIQC
jgi:glucose-1-phosphate thymidylyltransferase